MSDPSTNTTTIAADCVVVWNADNRSFVNVLDLFKSNLVEPDIVDVPTQDAVETALRYSAPSDVKLLLWVA